MSRAWMAQLLLMPLFVISQETCSSVTCSNNPGDPGNARLGNDTTALLHFQVASTTTTTLPACVAEINTGDCNAMNACRCSPDINPQPIGDFPDTQGTLQCGGKNSCQKQAASNTNFFKMNTPSPLECSGQDSCQKNFNVENIGSMCVTGDNAVGPSSQAGTYKLADPDVATGRVNDVCCAREVGQNQPTCKSPTFENVGSFFCTGDVSCDSVQATLSGDFYCRSLQGCGDQINPADDEEYWRWTTSGKHCIRCQSTDPGLDQGQPVCGVVQEAHQGCPGVDAASEAGCGAQEGS